jgi:uncharacterized protein (TIGR03435 family)
VDCPHSDASHSFAWPDAAGRGCEFEVATVKINQSGDAAPSREIRGAQIVLRNITLKHLLLSAYRLQEGQLSGAPGWLDSDRFDVVAKVPPETNADVRLVMRQNLLKKSFNLTVHQEQKLLPGFALAVSKHGAKLKQSEAGKLSCTLGSDEMLHAACQHATAKDIADMIMRGGQDYLQGRLVVDGTGLTGNWEYKLDWSGMRFYDAVTARTAGSGDAPPAPRVVSLFQSLEDQLGLRLESKMVPTSLLVIDHVDRVPKDY